MKDVMELVQHYTGVEIVVAICLLFLAFKGGYEAYKWLKNFCNEMYADRKKREDGQVNLESRLGILEKHDEEQREAISDLTTIVNMMRSELKEMKDAQEEQRLKNDFNVARRTILSYANKLKNGNVLTDDDYKEIFEMRDMYDDLVENHGFKNGRVDLSMRLIEEHYMRDPLFDDE